MFQDFNLLPGLTAAENVALPLELDGMTARRAAVLRLLRTACKNGVAALLATHDAQLAAWADRVVFVRDGVAVDQSAPPSGPPVRGATAGGLALLGVLLGTAGAGLGLAAVYRHDLSVFGRVPLVYPLIFLVGVPVLAAAGGWLLAGKEPGAISRRMAQ